MTTIKANDVTKYYKGSKAYKATFLDSQGRVLKNKMVSITVNGKKYSKKTDSKGLASFLINLKPGTYKVTATNPSTGYKLTTSFKILSTVTSSSIKKVKGDSKKFVAKFLKSNGKPLSKKQVKVKINGKTYKHKTNSKGEVRLSFNDFKPSTYKVICYNNDGLSKTGTVKLYKKASTKLTVGLYIFLPEDNKKIRIKFTTDLDDNSKSRKTIEITIGGMSYYKKTNADGEINFELPSLEQDVYEIGCYYAGNKFFKSSYRSNFATILSTCETELTVESDTSFGNYAGTPLRVAFSAGGVALVKRTVSFTIDENAYNVTTDNYGIASLPIYLDVGNYTVNYETLNDSKVKGSSGSCEINVFERIKTNISCSFKTSYKDTSQSFKVHLTDFNGTPMAYEDVELILGGETYYGTTNSMGYVTFNTNVAVGKYKFSVVFRGNNNYTSSSLSSSTTVALSKYGKGINEKNAAASKSYLKATSNCQVTNSKIKSLVKSLTKGLTNKIDKAKAIFNYVRDNIDYDYYYDTHKGAVKTLTSKSGNCVDQAHLLVALYRAAGLKARYVHGVCDFGYGTYGHVWTQVLVDKTWICGDPIDYCNDLGKINGWNTKTYKLRNIYLSLPF